ncbi:hypothetical protein FKW77_007845 [Venturia effusa]|uniref:MARVEL domain-containing protein n=1 Tax=Venturia effusa TaxID=50376 RepID=A0A517LB95_9PEZI|nr:hypothetical protein FKW77_007845 [Venturia effusa]
MAPTKKSTFASKNLRALLFAILALQWSSGAIVLGICVHFMANFQQTKHMKYHTIISSFNTWMYGFGQCFSMIKRYKGYGVFIHLGFSYLWLTSFIFSAQDYNFGSCADTEPPEAGQCNLKYTLEAFAFVAFFFSFMSIPLEILLYVIEHYKTPAPVTGIHEHHMATPVLINQKHEERILRGTFLDVSVSENSTAPTAE